MNPARHEYERRMHRVLAHIDAHLAAPLDLPALAAVANFSPFHFHRLFGAWMGETPGDYVRRRRLQVAAAQLLSQPRLGVLPAALGVGFGSAEAFTRAFRAHFGAAPSVWRAAARDAGSKHGQVLRNPGQAEGRAADDHGGTLNTAPPDVQLLDLPPVRIAYLRHHGPYGPAVHAFWAQRVGPWLRLHGRAGRDTYGLAHDDPGCTRPADCRYDAGVALAPGEAVGRDELTAELPGGRYAVWCFDAPVQHIDAAWRRLLRHWLPDTGLQLDARPCLERYRQHPVVDPASGHLRCEICLPVAPL